MNHMSKLGVVAGSLLACAGAAFGQNCSNGVIPTQCTPLGNCNGPDVIVGDLNGVSNYTNVGTIDAISVGTTSCNIGNVWLNWIQSTNQHPAISQTAFKMKTGANGVTTFEQIGQSWLKHGFFALSQNLCCSGCQSTDGTHLGVHCSDPYTSARNGSQGGLGPKWQVNASTGAFTYPPANPTWSGSVARRCQLKAAEMEPSSASVLYFVAGQYVTPDDATTNNGLNKYNNESYRRCNVSGSGSAWTFSFNGTTQRAQQAIRAWQDTDGNVLEADVPVGSGTGFSEGLFIVAMKATDLGNGMWNYEYAVQNMNSHRSGGTFEVPIPAGVMVTNIGFHDVDYHSGDGPGNVNFSGTDWTASKINGEVSDGSPLVWSTEDFAQNQSANALRWGTLYNFRFDANVAPRPGEVTIGLWRPGNPGDPNSVMSSQGRVGVPGEIPVPTCPCDWNDVDGVNSQDFVDFLADFFNNNADYNSSGLTDTQDFFDFLGCFFAPPMGC
ncbi:MAG: hypothetical protein AB7O77_07835 [Phycisphaerales bacterium]